jgi:hypothetical protein
MVRFFMIDDGSGIITGDRYSLLFLWAQMTLKDPRMAFPTADIRGQELGGFFVGFVLVQFVPMTFVAFGKVDYLPAAQYFLWMCVFLWGPGIYSLFNDALKNKRIGKLGSATLVDKFIYEGPDLYNVWILIYETQTLHGRQRVRYNCSMRQFYDEPVGSTLRFTACPTNSFWLRLAGLYPEAWIIGDPDSYLRKITSLVVVNALTILMMDILTLWLRGIDTWLKYWSLPAIGAFEVALLSFCLIQRYGQTPK